MDMKLKNTNFDNAKPVSATPALARLQAMETTISLCLPASLKQSVEQVARDDGTSLNQFIVTSIAGKLAAIKTVEYFREREKHGDLEAALALLSRKGGELPQEGDGFL